VLRVDDHAVVAAEEAMALALAAAKAARDAAAMVEEEEFPTEFDLLRLERARLSDMEQSFRVEYDAETALLEAEQGYLQELESLLGGVSNLFREADVPNSDAGIGEEQPSRVRSVDVTVKSRRRMERMRKRERALEKAEKVATTLASLPAMPKPKKPQITADLSDPIRAYLRDIGKSKLLTSKEEAELSYSIQDLLKLERVRNDLEREVGREPTISEWSRAVGMEQNAFEMRLKEGRYSKDKMVNSNLRLVVSIAKNYQGRGMALQDLIQEGSLGLIRGAEKFDPTKGFKFSTYAHWWIRQAVTRAIADQSRTIRLPIHLYEVISRINKAKKVLFQEHGRQPRDEEIAAVVGLTVEKMKSVVKSARAPTSMERPIGKEADTTVGELIADKDVESPEDKIVKQLLKQDLEGVLRTLNPREREVLRLRFGLDDGRAKTLEEIGTIFKVTRERIRQIEAKAMRKLRQPSRNSILREYLEVRTEEEVELH
jgi:RNA polymerase sigma factor (RpoD-like family)